MPREGALERPVLVGASRLDEAPSVPTMTECEDGAEPGAVCPSCGKTLPNPKPLRSWMAVRHEGNDANRMPVDPSSYYRKHRNAGEYARRMRAA
jgi:hypothetical protein